MSNHDKPKEQKPPEKLSINDEKGYDALVKEMQRYLMYVLPDLVIRAYFAQGQGKPGGDLLYKNDTTNDPEARKRLKRVHPSDTSANTNLLAALARTANAKYMRKIPPNVLSGLMPMIKVYKIHYPNGLRDSKSVSIPFEVPFDDAVLPLGGGVIEKTIVNEKTRERVTTNLDITKDLLNNHRGGIDTANLVSFDYQFIGTNPAETETSITANMKLKFATVDALLAKRTLIAEDGKTKLTRKVDGKEVPDFSYSDLVNSATKNEPGYYRIKVRVGYQRVTQNYVANLLRDAGNIYGVGTDVSDEVHTSEKVAKQLTDAINESHVILFLYPVSHELNFNENGTIDMSISFHGAIESSMVGNESNVLLVSKTGKELAAALKAIEEERTKKLDALKKKYDKSGEQKGDEYEKQREEINKKQDELANEKYKDLHIIYEDFLGTLYSSGKVRSIAYDPKILGLEHNTWSPDTIEDNGDKRQKDSLENATPPVLDYSTYSRNDERLKSRIEAIKGSVAKNTPTPQAAGSAATSAGTTPGAGIPIGTNIPDRINFLFVQDIILYALKVMGNDSIKMDDVYLILGNMVIPAAKKAYGQVISTSAGPGGSNDVFAVLKGLNPIDEDMQSKVLFMQYNIGTIPVSLEYFNKWFFNTVIKTNKTDWKLKNFLYDLMELIRLAATNIFGTHVSGAPGSRTLLGGTEVGKPFGNTLGSQPESVDFSKLLGKNILSVSKTESSNVLYLFVPALITNQINPIDVIQNEKYNVFTFTMGSNVGLVKKISYKKMDIPGVREARISQAGEGAAGVLRMKYDADIEMYGPCYFRPGDIVVINPVFMSKVSANHGVTLLADELGLGGVYMVLKTNTDVSRDGLKTTLNTVFQSYGTLKIRPLTEPDHKK